MESSKTREPYYLFPSERMNSKKRNLGFASSADSTRNKRKEAFTKDKPLYVMIRDDDEPSGTSLFIVIKDGREQQHQEDDIIFDADAIPRLSYRRYPDTLVAINSNLYLIGGYKPEPPELTEEFDCLNLQDREPCWRTQPLPAYHRMWHVASCKDGLIYALGVVPYILDPASGAKMDMVCDYVPLSIAVSKSKIYAYAHGAAGNYQHLLLTYDFEEKKWDCIFSKFWADWSCGVVLMDSAGDAYMVAYGSRHPIERVMERPGVWVFDIRRRRWLHEPVKGLVQALPVIPVTDWDASPLYYLPSLFQIGAHKFALVWENEIAGYELHCHKFTLKAPTTDQPFVAELLSSKVHRTNGRRHRILGCAVGLETEPGREDVE